MFFQDLLNKIKISLEIKINKLINNINYVKYFNILYKYTYIYIIF